MAELKGRGNTVDVGADCYGVESHRHAWGAPTVSTASVEWPPVPGVLPTAALRRGPLGFDDAPTLAMA